MKFLVVANLQLGTDSLPDDYARRILAIATNSRPDALVIINAFAPTPNPLAAMTCNDFQRTLSLHDGLWLRPERAHQVFWVTSRHDDFVYRPAYKDVYNTLVGCDVTLLRSGYNLIPSPPARGDTQAVFTSGEVPDLDYSRPAGFLRHKPSVGEAWANAAGIAQRGFQHTRGGTSALVHGLPEYPYIQTLGDGGIVVAPGNFRYVAHLDTAAPATAQLVKVV